ncbi:alpha/beta hydrolase [Longispora urticae]
MPELLVEGSVDRTVVLCGFRTDPVPELTWARGISLLTCLGPEDLELPGQGPVGIAAWSDGGPHACALAARHADRVDRLVLLAVPIPENDSLDLSQVTAKTLLLYGAKDPLTGTRHATWWQRLLPGARIEMQPNLGHDLLKETWRRALSHLAPHAKR